MNISDLLLSAKLITEPLASKTDITSITADSRAVTPGAVFVAIPGVKEDGAKYIQDAIGKGASLIVTGHDVKPQIEKAAWLAVENPRLALSSMAATFHSQQPKHIAAITGTDGKTSTADFFRQLWALSGKSSAAIGTLGVTGVPDGESYGVSHTTPDPVKLHETLSTLAYDDVQYIGMEASSHGLDQYRLDGVRIEAAAFTNLTRDHLDYHKTEEAYLEAKARLFKDLLPEGRTAVINADDTHAARLMVICAARKHRLIRFGNKGREYIIRKQTPLPTGQKLELELHGKQYSVTLDLIGNFQIKNILAALGLYEGTGGRLADALQIIPRLQGVPGRLEKAGDHPSGASIYVDYAHTPAALENLLKTVRPHARNKLHVVFGCGGDRDKGKRPLMGKAAASFADQIIITDDNPRSEPPDSIRAEVLAGIDPSLHSKIQNIGDRREAIKSAITSLQKGDVLVIAGKGHEKTQTIGKDVLPFDDVEVVRESL